MRRIIALVIFVCVLAGLTACADSEQPSAEVSQPTTESTPTDNAPDTMAVEVQYVHIGGYSAEAVYPSTVIIRSLDELYDYYETSKYEYDLWNERDGSVSFVDAIDQYRAAFFEDNALVFVLLAEPSGSVRHRVRDVAKEGDMLSVYIDRLVPESGTDDMAQWHIIIEVAQSVADTAGVDVVLNEVLETQQTQPDISEDKLTMSNGSVAIVPYEVFAWSETYDAASGNMLSADGEPIVLEQLEDELPELTVTDEISISEAAGCANNRVRIYDAQYNEMGDYEQLDVSALTNGPGTYYVRFDVSWQGEYIEEIDAYNAYGSKYIAKINYEGVQDSLADQLRYLGAFDWADITHAQVTTITYQDDVVPERITPITDIDETARLLALLSGTAALPAEQVADASGWTQVVQLYCEQERVMTIERYDEGLHIRADGTNYTLEASPWLYEQIVEAVVGCRVMSLVEAEHVARQAIRLSEYEHYFEGRDYKLRAQPAADGYRYNWSLAFHLIPNDQDAQGWQKTVFATLSSDGQGGVSLSNE